MTVSGNKALRRAGKGLPKGKSFDASRLLIEQEIKGALTVESEELQEWILVEVLHFGGD